MKRNEFKGRKFNRLTVLSKSEVRDNRTFWLCRCECGTKKMLYSWHVKSGAVKSCGCHNREVSATRFRTHGKTGTKLHIVWKHMRARCLQPGSTGYENYGGRGIRMCERWDSYEQFVADVGASYEEHVSAHGQKDTFIERIDCNGNYEPRNVKWATRAEQNSNKRNNRLLTKNGITKPLTHWARELGITHSALSMRLKKGWSVEDAITFPRQPN